MSPSTHPSPAPDAPSGSSSSSGTEQLHQSTTHQPSSHAPVSFPPKNCRACSGAQHMIDTFKRLTATGHHPDSHQQQHSGRKEDAASMAAYTTSAAAATHAAEASGRDAGRAASNHPHSAAGAKQGQVRSSADVIQGPKTAVVASEAKVSSQQRALPCPPETGELGTASWTFLHTMAAYYPDAPTGGLPIWCRCIALRFGTRCHKLFGVCGGFNFCTGPQRSLMRSMMEGLAEFYPCSICAEHLRQQIQDSPPDVSSASALSLWLCKIHNEVNEMLGKPMFDCGRVMERWRDGPADGSCG